MTTLRDHILQFEHFIGGESSQTEPFVHAARSVIATLNKQMRTYCENVELQILFENEPIVDKLCVFNGPVAKVGKDSFLVSIHTWDPESQTPKRICMSSIMARLRVEDSIPNVYEFTAATSDLYTKMSLATIVGTITMLIMSKLGKDILLYSYPMHTVTAWAMRQYTWHRITEEDADGEISVFVDDAEKQREIIARAKEYLAKKKYDFTTPDVEIYVNALDNAPMASASIQDVIVNKLPRICPQFVKHIDAQVAYEDHFNKLMSGVSPHDL